LQVILSAAGKRALLRHITADSELNRPVEGTFGSLLAGDHIFSGRVIVLTLVTDTEIHSTALLDCCLGVHMNEDDKSGMVALVLRGALDMFNAAGTASVVRTMT
jgi:hypothetical protein